MLSLLFFFGEVMIHDFGFRRKRRTKKKSVQLMLMRYFKWFSVVFFFLSFFMFICVLLSFRILIWIAIDSIVFFLFWLLLFCVLFRGIHCKSSIFIRVIFNFIDLNGPLYIEWIADYYLRNEITYSLYRIICTWAMKMQLNTILLGVATFLTQFHYVCAWWIAERTDRTIDEQTKIYIKSRHVLKTPDFIWIVNSIRSTKIKEENN